jgi:hypothetical protein
MHFAGAKFMASGKFNGRILISIEKEENPCGS